MDYVVIKTVHQAAVALSVTGFFARGWGSLAGAEWTRGRVAKTLPHLIDTVLLTSALLLAWALGLTPAAAPWLTAKIVGLLVYIALGMLALRPGRPAPIRAAAWIAAMLTFAWIVSVAISKNPLGFFALTGLGAQRSS
ncbi:MAG: SirB2 family protein [Burkholderiales bacterium]